MTLYRPIPNRRRLRLSLQSTGLNRRPCICLQMSSDWNAACRDSAWVAGSRSSLFSGPEAFRQQPRFCRLKFPGLMKKTKKTRSGGTGCGTQWVSGSRRGNQLNAAAGRRTAVAAGQVFNAPGGAPGIRGTPAGRQLSRAAGKNRAARRQKRSQKQLITSLQNRPFYHLLHRKGASSRTRNMTPCRCGQKNCLCRRAGILTRSWRNRQPGSSGWLPCVLSRRKGSLSWKEILPRKVRSSLTCRHIHFLTCWRKLTTRAGSGWAC